MRMTQWIAVAASISFLAACTQNGQPGSGVLQGGAINKQDIGTLAGAGLGAWAGSNIGGGKGRYVGAAGGALLGALLGSEIGKSLDNSDRMAMNQTTQRALEYQQPGDGLPWQATNSGTVIPGNYYQRDGRYCREFTQRIDVGGRMEEAYGTACRQPDGSWKIIQ